MIDAVFCVEGDPYFFSLLEQNLAFVKEKNLFCALLSSEEGAEKELVRTHAGTASSLGNALKTATTLDAFIGTGRKKKIDVLKIDVDGFDGKVLGGARRVIAADNPDIIFEWHPLLCIRTGNDWSGHFELLSTNGYNTFLFFTKFGEFSHFMEGNDRRSVAMLADLCINSTTYEDWHYDVIALHSASVLSPRSLADAKFAHSKRSPF
jgi:hypothetical protein